MSCCSKADIWYLYLIKSEVSGKIYTGISPDPMARLMQHNAGKGAKATRAGRPWILSYLEQIGAKNDALRRELQVKKLSRNQKLALIAHGQQSVDLQHLIKQH